MIAKIVRTAQQIVEAAAPSVSARVRSAGLGAAAPPAMVGVLDRRSFPSPSCDAPPPRVERWAVRRRNDAAAQGLADPDQAPRRRRRNHGAAREADFLHVLIEGSVELHAAWGGSQTTMAILQPVTTFILAATITDPPRLMSARTLEKTRVILPPSEDVRAIFRRDRAFADAVVVEPARF